MANTKDTDLLIVSRGNQTYKTTASDLMGVSGNISIDSSKKSIDLTADIDAVNNFGPSWDKNEQPLGRLYVNTGKGAVHKSWIYIGGELADAELGIKVGTGSGGYVTAASPDLSIASGILQSKEYDFTVDPLDDGTAAELKVTVTNGFISNTEIVHSGKLINTPVVSLEFDATDGKGDVVSVNVDEQGLGYVDGITYDTTSDGGSGLKVTVACDTDGKITDITSVENAGTGYLVGEQVTINHPSDDTLSAKVTVTENTNLVYNEKKSIDFALDIFVNEIQFDIIQSGSGFSGSTHTTDTYGGSSTGLKIKYDVANGELTNPELVVLKPGYADGDSVFVKAYTNDPLAKYGLNVTGSEIVTWLGVAANDLSPKPDEGWVLFTTLATGDDDGFVRKEGDNMFGTLFMDDTAIPAISAKDNIITEKDFSGKNLDVTEYITGGYLTIAEDASIAHDLTIGEAGYGAKTYSNNETRHNELAGYRQITGDGKKIFVLENGATIEKEIEDRDFIPKAYADSLALGGGGGNSLEYDLNVPPQSDSGSGVDYAAIQLLEKDLANGGAIQPVGLVRLTPGNNIVLTSDDGQNEIEIASISTKVIFSENAPLFEEGNFWYNTTDGRIYIGYTDLGNDSLPATDQWVDASPSAINGGDFVYRYGDQVENYLLVNGYFNAKHYDLGLLPDISARK